MKRILGIQVGTKSYAVTFQSATVFTMLDQHQNTVTSTALTATQAAAVKAVYNHIYPSAVAYVWRGAKKHKFKIAAVALAAAVAAATAYLL